MKKFYYHEEFSKEPAESINASTIDAVKNFLEEKADGKSYLILPDTFNVNDVVRVISYSLYKNWLKKLNPKAVALLKQLTDSDEFLENKLLDNPEHYLNELGFLRKKQPTKLYPYYKFENLVSQFKGSFYIRQEVMSELTDDNSDHVKWFNVEKCCQVYFSVTAMEEHIIG
jgi:hypothetical protein